MSKLFNYPEITQVTILQVITVDSYDMFGMRLTAARCLAITSRKNKLFLSLVFTRVDDALKVKAGMKFKI